MGHRPLGVRHVEAGDELVDDLRDGRVLADEDEAGGRLAVRILPVLEHLDIAPVEDADRRLEKRRDLTGIVGLSLRLAAQGTERAPDLVRLEVLPQVAVLRKLVHGDHVVVHGNPGKLHDAALEGVHEREVAHRPGEERALPVSAAAQEERRRGKIHDTGAGHLRADGLEPRDPQTGRLLVLLRLVLLLGFELSLLLTGRVLGTVAVAVVRLVVDHEDVLETGRVAEHAADHLPSRLHRLRPALSRRSHQHGLRSGRQLEQVLPLECVIVRDDDPGGLDQRQHVLRNELAMFVVGFGIVRQKDAEPVLDRDAGRRYEEAVRELRGHAMADGIHGLPGDDHRHDRGLAGAGRELEGDTVEIGVRVAVRERQLLQNPLALRRLVGDLRQPDQRLDGLHLAEERTDVREVLGRAPPFQEPGRFRSHAPALGGKLPPGIHLVADGVDEVVRRVVDAVLSLRKEIALLQGTALSLRDGDRRLETRWATVLKNLARRQVVRIHLPMPPWIFIR